MVFQAYETLFRVDERYELDKVLGKGAYGSVCSVKDRVSKKTIAIKKIHKMSHDTTEAKQTLREVKLLSQFGTHQNITELYALQIDVERDEIYLFMTKMDTDLHKIIQSTQKLSEKHTKHFLFQLLRGLQFLHDHSILHRDLKPANLLVNKNCHLRISDFGLARAVPREQINIHNRQTLALSNLSSFDSTSTFYSDLHIETKQESSRAGKIQKVPLTKHIVTRWYRAPELMLNPTGFYSSKIDMWSVGCIFGELLRRSPIFPGEDFKHQLKLIFETIGTPKLKEVEYIKNVEAIKFLNSLEVKKPKDFKRKMKTTCEVTTDLCMKLLCFDQNKRFSIKDCFEHEYFTSDIVYATEIQKLEAKRSSDKCRKQHLNVALSHNQFESRIASMSLEDLKRELQTEVKLLKGRFDALRATTINKEKRISFGRTEYKTVQPRGDHRIEKTDTANVEASLHRGHRKSDQFSFPLNRKKQTNSVDQLYQLRRENSAVVRKQRIEAEVKSRKSLPISVTEHQVNKKAEKICYVKQGMEKEDKPSFLKPKISRMRHKLSLRKYFQ